MRWLIQALMTGLAFNGLVLSAADAAAEDAATACAKLIGSLSIKSGTDYDTFASRLKAKGWHQTLTTTQNISSWTRSGHTISVTLNLGSGTSATTTGAVRCRN